MTLCPECGAPVGDPLGDSDGDSDGRPIRCVRCARRPFAAAALTRSRSRPTPDPDAPTSRKAVWSLVLGMLSCGCTPLPGIVLGVLALIDLEKNPRRLRGREFAIAGIVTSVIILPLFGLLLPIACPGFVQARNRSRMLMCQENLTRIDGAKEQWSFEHDQPVGALPTEADLVGPDGYMQDFPMEPTGAAYVIGAVGDDPICTSGLPGHSLEAFRQRVTTPEEGVRK